MKVAITADVHLHPFSDYATLDSEGRNSRLREIADCLDRMLASAIARGCTRFIIAGDLFHARKEVPTVALDAAGAVFTKHHKRIRIVCVRGNHDMDTSTSAHSLSPLAGLVEVIDRPMVDPTSAVGYLPWVDDQKEAARSVAKLVREGAKYLVAHLGVSGAKLGPLSLEIPGHLSMDACGVASLKWVVLGHYHKHQRLACAGNVWYVGSPLQHGWGEWGEVKGFFIAEGPKLEFVENTESPRFLKVTRDTAVADEVRKGDYIKVVAETEDAAAKLRENVRKVVKAPTDAPVVATEITTTEGVKSRLTLDEADLRSSLIRYIKHVGRPPGIGKSALADVGCALLQGTQE